MADYSEAKETAPWSVLVVEDDDGLRNLIVRRLRKCGYEVEGVSNGRDAIDYIDAHPSTVVLMDQQLPGMTGQETVSLLMERGHHLPFIMMTGQGDERFAVEMMKLGAADYLIKDLSLVDNLPGALQRLFSRLDTENRLYAAENSLKIAAEEQRILLDHMQPQVWYLTEPYTYGALNEAHASFLGASKEFMAFKKRDELPLEYIIEPFWRDNDKVFRGESVSIEERITRHSGREKYVYITKTPVFREDGSVKCAVCSAEDITERKLAERDLLKSKEQIRSQQEKFQKQLLLSIIQIMELYDMYTSGHSENVARYSAMIAERFEPDPEWVRQIYWTGLVHDIGKLLVPTEILNKPSKLNNDEYELVKKHPFWGAKVLGTSEELREISRDVLYHHERFDGKGYPEGISGTEIPLASRIISVADAFDAMTSGRSYQQPVTAEKAIEELQKNRGTQFDPEVVSIFISLNPKPGNSTQKS